MTAYNPAWVHLAIDLMNTYDPSYDDAEQLATPADLRHFLLAHELPPEPALELDAVRRLRGAMRAVVESEDDDFALRALNKLLDATRVRLGMQMSSDGSWQVGHFPEAGLTPMVQLETEAALGLALALERHGRERLRVCAVESCREVFIDLSRNRSRRYCSDRCANRHNVAAYRARQRG